MSESQWYSNKDLFEKINELSMEMKETRHTIRKYNGLYNKMDNLTKEVYKMKSEQVGKMKTQENIIKWGGWIFSLVTLVILIYKTIS